MDNVIVVDFGEQSKHEAAERRYRRALKIEPRDVRSLINLANLLARRSSHTSALKLYRKACRIDPTLWEAHYNLGYCLYQMQQYPRAIRSFERALTLSPQTADIRINLAKALDRNGRRYEAAQQLREYLEQQPSGQWASVARKRLAMIEQNTAH